MSTTDEFGRVMPALAALSSSREGGRERSDRRPRERDRSTSPPPYHRGRSRDRERHHHSSSHHHHASRRHDHRSSGSRDRYATSGGRDRHHPHRHHHHHRSRDNHDRRKRPRSPSSSPSEREDIPHAHDAASTKRQRNRHPCYRYVEEPMLCQYLWKSGDEAAKLKLEDNNNENSNINDDKNSASGDDINIKKEQEDSGSNHSNTDNADDNNEDTNSNKDDKEDPLRTAYTDYRRRYCLNYVRSFFNTHMDDSWFRSRYSPLGRKRAILVERERAQQEALRYKTQLHASLEGHNNTTDTKKDRCSLVVQARLGGGIKSSVLEVNLVPATHSLSMADPDTVLHATDVPPHVTDEQLTLALMDHCVSVTDQAEGSPVAHLNPPVLLVSGSVSTDRQAKHPLRRDAFLICSPAVRQGILHQLQKAHVEARENTSANKDSKDSSKDKPEETTAAVPRKEMAAAGHSAKLPPTLPLDVECSDPYGRLELDGDGKGGAPEDGAAVPHRKSTVWVKTQFQSPPLQVLSAAVSSKERIASDKEAAIRIARGLDVATNIPAECRLDVLLEALFGQELEEEDNANNEEGDATNALSPTSKRGKPPLAEDMLDVAISYLRRVHLLSFYNGCTRSECVADVLSGRHAAGTIHMRLHNADEILKQDREDNNLPADDQGAPKDLLVMRLDSSIAKALEQCDAWEAAGGTVIVDETADQEGAEIEQAENGWKDAWLENHAMIDDDGRARCSFHFCHKLFKDRNFLRKHLMKKHKEFLRAELAQLHDEYMMKTWDEEDQRPVPPVLVDCGANFGLVPSPVVGAEPMAEDPEPDLWRQEEERRKREEELQQQRQQRAAERRNADYSTGGGEGGRSADAGVRRPPKNFVDVDDMKEEKVEMAFDDIDVPVKPPKKKKKKKLL